MQKYLVGVDEAGRGPLAGPVSVGVACVTTDFDWRLLPGVNDSKLLSEVAREQVFTLAQELRKIGELDYRVAMVGPRVIDNLGISRAVSMATIRALQRLQLSPAHSNIKLDGLLKAPERFVHQETIIKGDASEPIIGLASILAKVTRDRHMCRLATKREFGVYGFGTHKGYGTRQHRQAIRSYGLSNIHRASFCSKLV